MNYVLGEHLNNFSIVYLDDIIIYLNSEEEHKEYIKWVLRKLYKRNMPVTIKKMRVLYKEN